MSEESINANEIMSESEIDSLLSEEDPDFVKQLDNIKIDNARVDLSLMDQVLVDAKSHYSNGQLVLNVFRVLFDFKYNARRLIFFWALICITFSVVIFVLKTKTWSQPDSLFLTSFAEWGVEVHSYNPLTESEMFFDNSRLFKNIMTIKKMVANIKPSENSGPNPMLAFELNIEGMTSEVVVEIKDREAEFKDLILRTVEELNYDDLSKNEGKQNLSEKILNVINSNLTRGQIRKVLYKSFILKN